MEEQVIRISVRNLVEFILREGDIDNRIAGSMDKDLMLRGTKIHRKIQKQMGSNYQAEVSLKASYDCGEYQLVVEGRADGIFTENDAYFIDEIKGVLKNLEHLEEPIGIHLSQAKCYAYIYARDHDLKEITVQMTYSNLDTEEIKRFRVLFSFEELEVWFLDLVEQYKKWASFQITWKKERNQSIRQTEFPFPYREGQRELVSSVYRTILRKKKLFIQAPTGVGKTMATVFPAVRAVGEGLGEKIFYLTAKTIARTVAEQAFHLLQTEQQLQFKTITLTAKDKICFCEERECNPDICPYAKGHFDRVNDAVFHLITHNNELTRDILEENAQLFRVCPFEMALDASLWVDAVICDYNYAFDPNAHLKRFFSEGSEHNYLFLIDEAHNLVERGREMYSAEIYKEDILQIKRAVQGDAPVLAKRLEECNKQFLALKRECEDYVLLDNVSHIALKMLNILSSMEQYFDDCKDAHREVSDEVMDFYFRVRDFVNVHEMLDENYVIYSEMERGGRFKVKLFCVNPSVNLQNYLSYGNSTIFFSATLLPVNYYKDLLSTEKDDYAIYAASTFPKENRHLAFGEDVSTKYTLRGESMYKRYVKYIIEMGKSRIGNYMVFFPSYQFMMRVYEIFLDETLQEDIESIVQSQNMNEEAREIFLETFEESREHSLIGFCVMGGVFAEGIDLSDDRLIGAAIVGTGIPQVCNEREILKNYFDQKGMSGFDFAYLYPGMNKVMQSAGRVIRTENDQGVILLLDDRFLSPHYRTTFPREWDKYEICNLNNVEQQLKQFWNNKKEETLSNQNYCQ